MDENGSLPKRPRYIQNNRKNSQLVDDENNLYHLARQSGNAIYWVCSRKKEFRCPGKAVVKRNLSTNDEEVYYTGHHRHDPGLAKAHKSGRIDVNSRNKVNKWTALHWAAKRNNYKVAKLLVDNGAQKLIENDKGKIPAQLTTDPKIRDLLEGENRFSEPCKLEEEDPLPFIPNYMTNIGPKVDVSIIESSPRTDVNGFVTPMPFDLETPEKICYFVKILQSGADENEYYKIHLLSTSLTLRDLIQKIATKFNINVYEIKKLRLELESKKIVITNDEDFEHLPEGSSFDVTVDPDCTLSFPSLDPYNLIKTLV